jgi:hypothetical protein
MSTDDKTVKYIVSDEISATLCRMKLIVDNSTNPVEVFLATQVSGILDNVMLDITNMLTNPSLEETAKRFYDDLVAHRKQ